MKYLFIFTTLFYFHCSAQPGKVSFQKDIANFTELIFKSKSNLALTTWLNHKFPSRFYLLSKTKAWSTWWFKFGKRTHEGGSLCIFSDTAMGRLFSEKERIYLASKAAEEKSLKITKVYEEVHLIDSVKQIKNGYVFSITNPIYSSDSNYVFIDMTLFYNTVDNNEERHDYYGAVLFMYKRIGKSGWVLAKKIVHTIL